MYKGHCINYSESELVSFSSTSVMENQTLIIQPINCEPYLRVNQLGNDLFEMCGPILQLFIEFAKTSRSWIKFRGKYSNELMVTRFLEEESSDIILGGGTVSQYLRYHGILKIWGIELIFSTPLGSYELNNIAAKVSFGSVPKFAYFRCFSIYVWILLLLSMLFLALVSKMFTKNIRLVMSFRSYVWNYATILLSKSMNESVVKSVPYSILSIWLISALFTSLQFIAHFYEFMVTGVPVLKIESLKDLSQRQDMKIIVRKDSSLMAYIELNSSLSEALNKQLDPYFDFGAENVSQKLIEKLPNGLAAYVNERLILILDLIKHFRSNNLSLDSIYISRRSATFEPYFLFISLNKRISPWHIRLLNKKIVMSKESGLYEFWNNNVLYYLGTYYSVLMDQKTIELIRFHVLDVGQLTALLYSFMFGIYLSLMYFLIEYFSYYVRKLSYILRQ